LKKKKQYKASKEHKAIQKRREAESGTVPTEVDIRRRNRGRKSMIADRVERSSGCNRCRAAR